MKQIQWYPGHMAKGIRILQENIKVVDLFVIIIDARVPVSSFNPNIEAITKNKNKDIIILLNKKDLANPKETEEWIKFYREKYAHTFEVNLKDKNDVLRIKKKVSLIFKKNGSKSKRIMIMGIPNVGKSTLINSFAGRKIVQEQNRPGVTKRVAWSKIGNGMIMLDSPGILMPSYEQKNLSSNLAYTNNIKLSVIPIEEVGIELIKFIQKKDISYLNKYLKKEYTLEDEALYIIEDIAVQRGMIKKGIIDYSTISFQFIKNFADGKMGPITLETFSEWKDKIE